MERDLQKRPLYAKRDLQKRHIYIEKGPTTKTQIKKYISLQKSLGIAVALVVTYKRGLQVPKETCKRDLHI